MRSTPPLGTPPRKEPEWFDLPARHRPSCQKVRSKDGLREGVRRSDWSCKRTKERTVKLRIVGRDWERRSRLCRCGKRTLAYF
jgi:hypothetical protein